MKSLEEKYKEKCSENEELKNKIKELENTIKLLTKNQKGKLCSINGNNYEKKVYEVVKNCKINGKNFNTQSEHDLGGSIGINDIECNFLDYKVEEE